MGCRYHRPMTEDLFCHNAIRRECPPSGDRTPPGANARRVVPGFAA